MDHTNLVGMVATICTVALYCTPIPTFHRVIQNKTTSDTPSFPFVIMFSSCSLWFKYAALKGDSTLMVVNCAGAVLNLSFVIIYYMHTIQRGSIHKQLLMACALLFPMLMYVNHLGNTAAVLALLGLYCSSNSVLAYAAPLSSLGEVIRSRSTQCMVFPLSLGNFVCALLWVMYGSLRGDVYVKVPNLLGVILGAAQLSLFLLFSKSSSSSNTSPTSTL